MAQARLFTRLDQADEQILSDWLHRVETWGIDAAIDLSPRRWNTTAGLVIVGIFEKHRSKASWLIVRCPFGWILASCTDGAVSDVSAGLSDILTLISDHLPA